MNYDKEPDPRASELLDIAEREHLKETNPQIDKLENWRDRSAFGAKFIPLR